MHKRASDIARRLAPLTSVAFKRGNPSPFKRSAGSGVPPPRSVSLRPAVADPFVAPVVAFGAPVPLVVGLPAPPSPPPSFPKSF